MTQLLAEQSYVKVVRTVDSISQTNTEEQRMMYLYEDRLVTRHREFLIDTIHDLSYRMLGTQGGLLYVHTNKGVFSYMIKSSPEQFIEVFKTYKKR
ncbi:hypothetical protein [Oceanobacillus alkalisoli]|uniref:hypothetical protein n=1 Tax=Oceanobacillus alkalisoli TaxID=2925113 RepID=UPI001EEFA289|nr:hypothetical protein [Oceanobacillus alkalisoli]MCF3943581.1 hypothetical protein [Oceanobacillus alkalisoli]MCG5102846.1 hypothetical protein [Oceanobacillus alkalisoli]